MWLLHKQSSCGLEVLGMQSSFEKSENMQEQQWVDTQTSFCILRNHFVFIITCWNWMCHFFVCVAFLYFGLCVCFVLHWIMWLTWDFNGFRSVSPIIVVCGCWADLGSLWGSVELWELSHSQCCRCLAIVILLFLRVSDEISSSSVEQCEVMDGLLDLTLGV